MKFVFWFGLLILSFTNAQNQYFINSQPKTSLEPTTLEPTISSSLNGVLFSVLNSSANVNSLNASVRFINQFDDSDMVNVLFQQALGDLEHSVKEEIASYLGIDVSILNRDNNDELMRAILETLVDKLNCKLIKILAHPAPLPADYKKLCLNEKIKLLMKNFVKCIHEHFVDLLEDLNDSSSDESHSHSHESHSHESSDESHGFSDNNSDSDSDSHSHESESDHDSHSKSYEADNDSSQSYSHESSSEEVPFLVLYEKLKCGKLIMHLLEKMELFFNKCDKKSFNDYIMHQKKFFEIKFRIQKLLKLIERMKKAHDHQRHHRHRHSDGYKALVRLQAQLKHMLAQLFKNIDSFFHKNEKQKDNAMIICKNECGKAKVKLGKLLQTVFSHSRLSEDNNSRSSEEQDNDKKRKFFLDMIKKFQH